LGYYVVVFHCCSTLHRQRPKIWARPHYINEQNTMNQKKTKNTISWLAKTKNNNRWTNSPKRSSRSVIRYLISSFCFLLLHSHTMRPRNLRVKQHWMVIIIKIFEDHKQHKWKWNPTHETTTKSLKKASSPKRRWWRHAFPSQVLFAPWCSTLHNKRLQIRAKLS
jgi:hypothetical protein